MTFATSWCLYSAPRVERGGELQREENGRKPALPLGDKGPLLAPARNRSWERANAIQSVFRGLTSGLLRGACILLFETIIQLKVDSSGDFSEIHKEVWAQDNIFA